MVDIDILATEGNMEEEREGLWVDSGREDGLEVADGSAEPTGECVDVDSVEEHGQGVWVGEVVPGCQGDLIPWELSWCQSSLSPCANP